jgi:iron complex outermembrane receptor protein
MRNQPNQILNLRLLATVFAISSVSLSVEAQTTDEAALAEFYGSPEMVSIATGAAQPLRESPAVASVITATDIAAIGATELNEVLETVPGLHVGVSSVGYKPLFSIRGIHTQTNPQILILINGLSIKNVFDGQLGGDWGRMPVTGIARIEVIRGPGSALYGADAFSGVINIITKSAADVRGLEIGARGGSFDRNDQYLQWGGDVGGFDAYFYLERSHSDGPHRDIDADAQTTLDGLFSLFPPASLAPGPVSLSRDNTEARADISRGYWRLRGGFQEVNDGGVGVGASQTLDPVGRGDGRRLNADLTYDNPRFANNLGVTGTLSYYNVENLTRLQLFPPGAFGGTFPDGVLGNPDVYERHYRGELSALYTGIARHRLRLGGGYRKEDLYRVEESRNYTLFDLGAPFWVVPVPLGGLVDVTDLAAFVREENRTVAYAFVQDEWNFRRDWTLTAGLRMDDYSDFGTTLNPRLALVWQTSYALTTKLLYGRAFRAPSFAELYNVNNPANIGNPSLDPETIDTVELGLDWDAGRGLRAAVNVFYYRMDDIIRFAPDPPPATSATAQNTGRQTGYGLEMELAWQASQRLRLPGNYANQKSTDEAADDDVGFAPSHLAYLRSDWALAPRWTLSGQATGVFDRKRAPGDVRSKVEDYVSFDLTLRGQRLFGDDWGMRLSARNLFNSDVREPSASELIPNDLPMAGRNVFVELSKAFH